MIILDLESSQMYEESFMKIIECLVRIFEK